MPKTQNTSGFSKRELKVLLLMSFSYETVKTHLRNMRKRHQVSSRAGAADDCSAW